jgi:hypothetical protein
MSNYTDTDLVKSFLNGFRCSAKAPNPLWAHVMQAFACGSTSAREICRRHGFDPDAKVKQRFR